APTSRSRRVCSGRTGSRTLFALRVIPGVLPMPEESVPYPPAPSNVPPYFTKPTASYRVRVIVVLSSLFLFGTLYVGLVAGLGYLCYWSFAGPGKVNVQDLMRDTGGKADNLI